MHHICNFTLIWVGFYGLNKVFCKKKCEKKKFPLTLYILTQSFPGYVSLIWCSFVNYVCMWKNTAYLSNYLLRVVFSLTQDLNWYNFLQEFFCGKFLFKKRWKTWNMSWKENSIFYNANIYILIFHTNIFNFRVNIYLINWSWRLFFIQFQKLKKICLCK